MLPASDPSSEVLARVGLAAVSKIAWPTVLLICGIVMYVGLLEELGSIAWLVFIVPGWL